MSPRLTLPEVYLKDPSKPIPGPDLGQIAALACLVRLRPAVGFSEVPGTYSGGCEQSQSDLLHDDVVCVLSESAEIAKVRGEHRSAWLGQGDDQGIDRRASPCQPPQQRSSPCQRFADLL